MTRFYEDDGIEIDDVSLLAPLTSKVRMIPNESGHE